MVRECVNGVEVAVVALDDVDIGRLETVFFLLFVAKKPNQKINFYLENFPTQSNMEANRRFALFINFPECVDEFRQETKTKE